MGRAARAPATDSGGGFTDTLELTPGSKAIALLAWQGFHAPRSGSGTAGRDPPDEEAQFLPENFVERLAEAEPEELREAADCALDAGTPMDVLDILRELVKIAEEALSRELGLGQRLVG